MGAGAVEVNVTNLNAKAGSNFDGVDDSVSIPHNANQLGANLPQGFTISAWILPRTVGEGGGGVILSKESADDGVDGFMLRLGGGNTGKFTINNGTDKDINGINLGVWAHVLVTVTSAQIQNAYVNGVIDGGGVDAVQTLATITTATALKIGENAFDGNRSFDGTIKDVKMWGKVLSATEIANEYTGINTTDKQVFWFKLESDYLDSSATGLVGTNSGTHFSISDDAVAAVIKGHRVSAVDKYLIAQGHGGQIVSAIIEEV